MLKSKSFWTQDLLVILLIVIGGLLVFRGVWDSDEPEQTCVKKEGSGVMRTHFLAGMIEKGSSYELLYDYYLCHAVQLNDVAAFSHSVDNGLIMKVVKGLPGQVIELTEDKQHKAWNVKVDGQLALQSNGQPLYFGVYPTPPPLGLYIKSNGNRLKPGHYLLFSTVSPGINDSGIVGVIEKSNLVGRVFLKENS